MGNNITGNSGSGYNRNGQGFNISNLFDLSKLSNMFSLNRSGNNPISQIGKMFGMNNKRQYRSPVKVLPIEEAYKVIKSGQCFLLDVRTQMEYNTIRIKGSVNVPLDKLVTDFEQMVPNKSELIIAYCATGSRVRRALQILWSLGYNNVCIWEGAGINTFAFADLIVYNDKRLENNSNQGGNNL